MARFGGFLNKTWHHREEIKVPTSHYEHELIFATAQLLLTYLYRQGTTEQSADFWAWSTVKYSIKLSRSCLACSVLRCVLMGSPFSAIFSHVRRFCRLGWTEYVKLVRKGQGPLMNFTISIECCTWTQTGLGPGDVLASSAASSVR